MLGTDYLACMHQKDIPAFTAILSAFDDGHREALRPKRVVKGVMFYRAGKQERTRARTRLVDVGSRYVDSESGSDAIGDLATTEKLVREARSVRSLSGRAKKGRYSWEGSRGGVSLEKLMAVLQIDDGSSVLTRPPLQVAQTSVEELVWSAVQEVSPW